MNLLPARTRAALERTKAARLLREEKGLAVDPASIMIGVAILGILGGAIAVALFAIVPWSHDRSAEQSASAIVSAETVYYTQNAGGTPTYGTLDQLVTAGFLEDGAADPAKVGITVASDFFAVAVRSESGAFFVATSEHTKPMSIGEANATGTAWTLATALAHAPTID